MGGKHEPEFTQPIADRCWCGQPREHGRCDRHGTIIEPVSSAVRQANMLMSDQGHAKTKTCGCGGGWYQTAAGEWVGAVHDGDCPRKDELPWL